MHETKAKDWDVITQIGENKLGFWGRLGVVLVTSRKPTGEYITTTPGIMAEAAKSFNPMPITIRKPLRGIASAVSGGAIAPNEPGQSRRQFMASLGLKGEVAQQPMAAMQNKAARFMKESGLRTEPEYIIPTDEPSYAKMRHSISIGDQRGAQAMLNELRKTKPEGHIIKAMEDWARRPFTGGKKSERMFINSMNDDDREAYSKAQQAKIDLLNRWEDWYVRQP
jgi:hypothetical protein